MKTERLFEITFILLERKFVTAAELASRFEVSVRTIYRDLDVLSACGIPIYTLQGKQGGIYLMEQYALNRTLLTDTEQSQIVMALQSLKATGQEDVAEPLSKLKGIFQKSIDDWIEIDFSSWRNNDTEKELFSVIRESIQKSKTMTFYYVNTKGEGSKRTVEPYKLVFKGQSWYLFAYCRIKADYRFFKLSRIEQPQSDGEPFERKNMRDTVQKNYQESNEEQFHVKLKISIEAGYRVLDELREQITETKDDSYIVEYDFNGNREWLLQYFLGFGDKLEILEPPELRQSYAKLLDKMIMINK